MRVEGKAVWSVLWKTFAALALPVLLTAQALDWTNVGNYRGNAIIFGLGLLGAFCGGLGAALMALMLGFAQTPLGKSLRAVVQAIVQVLSGLVFNEVADLTENVKIIQAGIPIVILAFVVAYFQNQGKVPNTGAEDAPRGAFKDAFAKSG